MQRGLRETEKRRCIRHPALTGRVGTPQIQKKKSCNAGHSARVVQRALYSVPEWCKEQSTLQVRTQQVRVPLQSRNFFEIFVKLPDDFSLNIRKHVVSVINLVVFRIFSMKISRYSTKFRIKLCVSFLCYIAKYRYIGCKYSRVWSGGKVYTSCRA